MADTVKLPVIGPTKKNYVMLAGALIVGFVGYAYWNRRSAEPPLTSEQLAEDIPQDREPPATIVGSEEFDTNEVRAIINTNTEWYTAAVEYLSSAGGYDFTFTTLTLGKFLARRELTDAESNLVQAAKGAVGEPPQGGPWPIIRGGASGPSTGVHKLATPTIRSNPGSLANTNYALSWTKVTGAAYYMLRRSRGPGSPVSHVALRTSATTPGLQRGATYGYQVRAMSTTPGMASSDWSSEVTFTVAKARAA